MWHTANVGNLISMLPKIYISPPPNSETFEMFFSFQRGEVNILKYEAHLHTSHVESIFSKKVYCQTLPVNRNPLWQYSADNAWLNFHFLSPSLTYNHPMHMCLSRARVCVPVYEALDIKANFNKVWRQAGGTGETCQAQTLSLRVQSHPVFTSSGQLAACSVCWAAWQSHIFHHEFYMNINNLKKIMAVTEKLLTQCLWQILSTPQYHWECFGNSKVRGCQPGSFTWSWFILYVYFM